MSENEKEFCILEIFIKNADFDKIYNKITEMATEPSNEFAFSIPPITNKNEQNIPHKMYPFKIPIPKYIIDYLNDKGIKYDIKKISS